MGTANVAGLSNKISVAGSLDSGIWGLTETHLTLEGTLAARSALKGCGYHQGRNLRLLTGAPAPARTVDSHAGTWTGVGLLSDFPCQVLDLSWPSLVYETGRVMAATTYVGQAPITQAVVYGPAQSPTFRDPLGITLELLTAVSDILVDRGSGPRCIMGDFNCDLMQYPLMDHWRSCGWQELQVVESMRNGKPAEATCKKATVRDFVWCSPELLRLWCQTEILHDHFPDHSVVAGRFFVPSCSFDHWYWPQPKAIPWDQVQLPSWHAAVSDVWPAFPWTQDTSSSFALWSAQFERSLSGFVSTPHGTLPPGTCGRGQHRKAKKGNPLMHRIKPSRPGELAMPLNLPDLSLCRWYRQLRRLQSLLHSCRKGNTGVNAATYQAQCWSSVIRAAGFKPNFVEWWPTRPVRLQSSPSYLLGLPSLSAMELIFTDFRLNYQHFEDWHRRQRNQLSKVRKESQTKELFRSLRPDGPEPLDFLTSTRDYQVLAVDPPTGAVLLDDAVESFAGSWTLNGEPISPTPSLDFDVAAVDRTWCLFESDCLPIPGHALRQTMAITAVPAIHDSLMRLWLPRWQALTAVPANAWDRIVAFTQAFVPAGLLKPAQFSLTDYRNAFRGGSALKTGGPDGWQESDMLTVGSA
eukprot:s344_g13.t1